MSDLYQRLLAELHWLQQTPDLIIPEADYRLPLPAAASGTEPQALPVERYSPGFRLGDRFEELVYFYLKYINHITDIKRNIQIKPHTQTLGELDFLLPIERQWYHLEVALKLYLLDGDGSSLSQFVGTRRDDCLQTKWQHMLEQQLTLSQRPEVVAILQQMGLDHAPKPSLWIKGWLFYHHGVRPAQLPALVNPDHLQGWWLYQSELKEIASPDSVYRVPRKEEWLLPAELMTQAPLGYSQLSHALSQSDRAQLVLVLEPAAGGWRETSRGFVVADSWGSTTQS